MIEFIANTLIELPLYAQIVYGLAFSLMFIYLIIIAYNPNILFNSLRATWYALKEVFSQVKNIRGILALLISWVCLSGIGLLGLGFILHLQVLKVLGTTIFLFWLAPATPLTLIVIVVGLVIQRYVLLDRNVKFSDIKNEFMKGWRREYGQKSL